MIKITFLFVLFIQITLNAQITFEYETATDNGNSLVETINGITVTTSYTDVDIIDANGFGGSTANIAATFSDNTIATFTFSEPVIVNSILAIEGLSSNIDYTFTPTGGDNSPVTASLVDGTASVILNWTNVTSFTVTSSTGNISFIATSSTALYGFDNLLINDSLLSTTDFFSENLIIYPNPVKDFLYVKNDENFKSLKVFNSLGQLVVETKNEKVDFTNLEDGIYFLQINMRNRIETKKIIKE